MHRWYCVLHLGCIICLPNMSPWELLLLRLPVACKSQKISINVTRFVSRIPVLCMAIRKCTPWSVHFRTLINCAKFPGERHQVRLGLLFKCLEIELEEKYIIYLSHVWHFDDSFLPKKRFVVLCRRLLSNAGYILRANILPPSGNMTPISAKYDI